MPSESLLSIPPEVRGIVLDFCFPPLQTYVQIVPYERSLPTCRLNLPVELYLVCKLITSELGPLPARLQRLDFTYIIRGPLLLFSWRFTLQLGVKRLIDPIFFPLIMRYAERVRLVGAFPRRVVVGPGVSPITVLTPGPDCALKVLEVQPCRWRLRDVALIMFSYLSPLTTHPDVGKRLRVRLIWDPNDPLVDDEDVDQALSGRGRDNASTSDHPADETSFRKIEAWLERYQDVADMGHRRDKNGPLRNYNE